MALHNGFERSGFIGFLIFAIFCVFVILSLNDSIRVNSLEAIPKKT